VVLLLPSLCCVVDVDVECFRTCVPTTHSYNMLCL
jgi:hypothetical protein